MDMLIPVEVPLLGDERRKNWAKIVVNVDPSKDTGWAFEGEFIATGGIQDVPVGSTLLVYGEKGSKTNPVPEVRVFTANADGTLSLEVTATGRAWARTLRDPVEELIATDKPVQQLDWNPELLRYSDDAIREEWRRRKLG